LQFLYVARGSLYELETHLCLAFDLSYIAEEKLNVFLAEVTECKKTALSTTIKGWLVDG